MDAVLLLLALLPSNGALVTLFELLELVVVRVHFYFAANKTQFVLLLYAREEMETVGFVYSDIHL